MTTKSARKAIASKAAKKATRTKKRTPQTQAQQPRVPTNVSTKSGVVFTEKGKLNVRKGPGTNYGIIGRLNRGDSVSIAETKDGWHKILYGTSFAYVMAKFVKMDGEAQPIAPTQTSTETTDSASSTTESTTPATGSSNISTQADPIGTATIKANAVNVRQGPGTNYERIGGLTQGKSVEVYEGTKDGWIKIKYGANEGWILQSQTDFVMPSNPDEGTLAGFIRDNYPNGVNICFAYNGESPGEFRSQANSFSKTYNCFKMDGTLTKQAYFRITKYSELKSNLLETSKGVEQCLKDTPRPGHDDSKCKLFKNLSIMCHGYETGLNLGAKGYHFNMSKIDDFASSCRSKLASDVHVQLYACSTALNKDSKANWYERRGTNGKSGADILEQDPFCTMNRGVGSFAQKLCAGLGGEATVYGHTTAGHICGNYAARCYGKEAGNDPNGKHMFDVYFPKEFVSQQAQRLGISEDKARTSMYGHYTKNYRGDVDGRDTFIDPEGAGQRLRNGWLAANP